MNKKELKKKYGEEEVLVIQFDNLSKVEDGLVPAKRYLQYDALGYFIRRYDAEGTPAHQQVIPYAIVSNIDETEFFVAKRIDGESRLAGKMSLGFGGHINPCDIGLGDSTIFNGLLRELDEEIDLVTDGKFNFIGTLRDMNSATNDHFGLAFMVHAIDKDATIIKETDKLIGEWMTKEELYNNYFKFEGWSKILIDYLYR